MDHQASRVTLGKEPKWRWSLLNIDSVIRLSGIPGSPGLPGRDGQSFASLALGHIDHRIL